MFKRIPGSKSEAALTEAFQASGETLGSKHWFYCRAHDECILDNKLVLDESSFC
jgi:hypothetical protein